MKKLKPLVLALAATSLLWSLSYAGENKDSRCCSDCKDCEHCCAASEKSATKTATSDKAEKSADAKTQNAAAKN